MTDTNLNLKKISELDSKVDLGQSAMFVVVVSTLSGLETGKTTLEEIGDAIEIDASRIVSGSIPASRIGNLSAVYQPLSASLTDLATVTPTSLGRNLVSAANAYVARLLLNGRDFSIGTTAPTQRADGSALQVKDIWLDTSDMLEWYWDGTFWLSRQQFIATAKDSQISNDYVCGLMPAPEEYNVFLEYLMIGGTFQSPMNATAGWIIGVERVNSAGVAVAVESVDLRQIYAIGSGAEGISEKMPINAIQDVSSLGVKHYQLSANRDSGNLGGPINSPSFQLYFRLAKI